MRLTWDPQTNAIYLDLDMRDEFSHTVEDGPLLLDVGKGGAVCGVEVLKAQTLSRVPAALRRLNQEPPDGVDFAALSKSFRWAGGVFQSGGGKANG